MARVDRYRTRPQGWNGRHFHAWYRQEGGTRRYTGVKDCSGLIETDTLIGGTYTIVRRKAWHNSEGHFSPSASSG